jgi:hypothetical protein
VKKFLVLYLSQMSATEQMKNATPEQAKAGMDAWMSWAGRAQSGIVDMGSPLTHATSVPGGNSGSRGPYVGGFSILQGSSADDVRTLLDDHPHLMMPGNTIEVHEFLPMPGM